MRDVPALARALDSFFEEHKLPRRGIRLGLATNRIGVRAFDVDGIADERQLANAIRFRAHEAVSIPIDEACSTTTSSARLSMTGGISRRILLAAAYRESIDRYVEAAQAARIELYGIDLEAFALLRAVGPTPSSSEGTPRAIVAVSLGHDRSTLAISDGAVCEFTRVLEWGGGKLESAIALDLGVTPTRRPSSSLAASLDPDADDQSQDPRSRQCVPRSDERSRSSPRTRGLAPALREPAGLACNLRDSRLRWNQSASGLPEELERLTRVEVRRVDPLVQVRTPANMQARDDLASLTVAIGLGVEA